MCANASLDITFFKLFQGTVFLNFILSSNRCRTVVPADVFVQVGVTNPDQQEVYEPVKS
jgi:hypothetical protein